MENWKGLSGCGNSTSKQGDWKVSDSEGGREGEVRGPGLLRPPNQPKWLGFHSIGAGGLKILRKEVTGYDFGQQAWPLHPPLHLLNLGVSISEIMTVPSLLQYWIKWDHWTFGGQPVSHPTYSFSSGVSVLVSYCGLPSHRFLISFVSDSSLQPTRPTSSQAWFWALSSVRACPRPYAVLHSAYLCAMLRAQPYPHLPTLCCRAQSPKKEKEGIGIWEKISKNKQTHKGHYFSICFWLSTESHSGKNWDP